MRTPVAIAVLLCACLSGDVFGADRVDRGTVLRIDFTTGRIADVASGRESALTESNRFTIRRNESITIEAVNNPLLFTYEGTIAREDTEEFKAALAFARQLQMIADLSKGASVVSSTIFGLDPAQFLKHWADAEALVDGLGADLLNSIGTAGQVGALKTKWAEKPAVADVLLRDFEALGKIARACQAGTDAILTTDDGKPVRCDGSVRLADNLVYADAVARETAASERVRIAKATSDKAAQAASAARAALNEAAAGKNSELRRQRQQDYDAARAKASAASALLQEEESALATIESTIDMQRANAGITLIAFVALADVSRPQGEFYARTIRSFAADVALLGTPIKVSSVQYSLQRQTITVEVKASTKYRQFMGREVLDKQLSATRKVAVVLEPYQPGHISLAPAAVLGFVRNPEFTAKKDGDTFKIEQKSDQLTTYTIAAMINITPDGWQEPSFGGHFQVGISPVKDSVGFYIGAGIRAQQLFSFGGGLMLQQVRRLADGLTLESRLDDPAKLKTTSEFARGLYLHITVDLPK